MKKIFLIPLFLLVASSCAPSSPSSSEQSQSSSSESSEETSSSMSSETNQLDLIWDEQYSDDYTDIEKEDIVSSKVFYDDSYIDDYSVDFANRNDLKFEFETEDKTRFVNSSDGYAVTLPGVDAEFDYSLSAYRTQAKYNDTVLTISFEQSSTYGNHQSGWEIYRDEWLIRYIDNPIFLEDNDLEYTHQTEKSSAVIEGYEVQTFSIVINDNENIEHPYYNISVVRKDKSYIKFFLFVSKSKTDNRLEHMEMIKSFKEVDDFGTSRNRLGTLELKENPNWNEETQNYFNYLLDKNTFDFGFFRYSLPGDNEPHLRDEAVEKTITHLDWVKETMDYEVEIIPTYTHLGFYTTDTYFPVQAAKELAGGNGFNGKPVLQFTLQYTRTNNNLSLGNTTNNHTPVYDVLRGYYDDYFRQMAAHLKEYEKPVLFRLNNEMNTDWTSYSGIISLLDPDIFQMSWRRCYDIFQEEGVDNCIWIFNPVADTCPYSSWGEDMCYFPGVDYVQALGLTRYEMLNDDVNSLTFAQGYGESSRLYRKNRNVWADYPWIISEFGCGSGGNTTGQLYRNEATQAQWVEDMFNMFSNKETYPSVENIAVAVWFDCNDVVGDGLIENALQIVPQLSLTIEAFKQGLAKIK